MSFQYLILAVAVLGRLTVPPVVGWQLLLFS